ncbi:hypothetical protein LLB_0768 [Legionella longbeachae D-4968]|nr:hypothetical protein LLB_0768 [Legionella longbeachae D-4968]
MSWAILKNTVIILILTNRLIRGEYASDYFIDSNFIKKVLSLS